MAEEVNDLTEGGAPEAEDDIKSDVEKCNKINGVVPTLIESIAHLQNLHSEYELDFDLTLASKRLMLIQGLEPQPGPENLETFVRDYQEHLTMALESMASFLNNSNDVETMTKEQAQKFGTIAANIIIAQDEIVKIAGS